jgi:acyl carrier protein
MTTEEIILKVDEILIEEFELEANLVVPDAHLREDLDMDSLDGVDLVVALEKTFSVRVADKAVMEMKTVSDIHAYIHANYGKQMADAAPAG